MEKVIASDEAQKVLAIYAQSGSRAGQALISNDFLAIARSRRWAAGDLQDGIEQARRVGWIERADRGWRLTQSGFDEIVSRHLAVV